jgi:hypothetical protein
LINYTMFLRVHYAKSGAVIMDDGGQINPR